MKGQDGELGRKGLNGTQWEEIGWRKEEERFCGDEGHFEKREEDKNNDDLKIGMENSEVTCSLILFCPTLSLSISLIVH